jgi:hypothetical protein
VPPTFGGPAVTSADVDRGDRWRALLVSAAVVVAVAVPGVRTLVEDDAPDGFPLSTYPMFSRDRGRVVELPTVVAVTADGTVERLSPATIAGTDQVMQASAAVRGAVADGPPAARALCAEVAARLPGRTPPVVTVEVVVERHDAIAWSSGSRAPLDRRTVASCEPP